jgi:hypothetical protein
LRETRFEREKIKQEKIGNKNLISSSWLLSKFVDRATGCLRKSRPNEAQSICCQI